VIRVVTILYTPFAVVTFDSYGTNLLTVLKNECRNYMREECNFPTTSRHNCTKLFGITSYNNYDYSSGESIMREIYKKILIFADTISFSEVLRAL
jgi:hypothetical protein